MASTVYHLFTVLDLAPADGHGTTWKNLPAGTAYALDAAPWHAGDYYEGYTNTTDVEITRVWRQRRQIAQQSGQEVPTTEVHQDISFQYKNVGSTTASFEVYLIVFT
jgi:hypothetical protein